MRSLAIIPARAGSKRVPGKNLCEVGGKTLLRRALESAHRVCDQTVVSTDDPLVIDEAERFMWPDEEWMPSIHQRQPEHASDTAQLEDVIADVIDSYDRVGSTTHGIGVDAFVLLQPTSPFRTSAHVEEALRVLRDTKCDSVVSVTRQHTLFRAFNGKLSYDGDSGDAPRYLPCQRYERSGAYYETHVGDEEGWPARPPSSWLGGYVHENGAIYAFTRGWWNRSRLRMGGDMRAIVMHWSEAVEIDTPSDLQAARWLAEGMAEVAK